MTGQGHILILSKTLVTSINPSILSSYYTCSHNIQTAHKNATLINAVVQALFVENKTFKYKATPENAFSFSKDKYCSSYNADNINIFLLSWKHKLFSIIVTAP